MRIAEAAAVTKLCSKFQVIHILMNEHVEIALRALLHQAANRTAALANCLDEHVVGGVAAGHDILSVNGALVERREVRE
ncbi:MAG: hypothetical protein JWO42_2294 [Chloroflexi bacterium]|nr:hypothetical protein [Chloroflexota bacterium]